MVKAEFHQVTSRQIRKGATVTRRARSVLFGLEAALSCGALALAVVTVTWRDWIESSFGIDPDKHSGSLEWLIAAAFLAMAVTCGAAARGQWRRLYPREA